MKAARGFVAFCFSIIMAVLTNVVFAWTILGCAAGPVHVAPAVSTSFQQMMAVEVMADARRPAHWMERYVRGDVSANFHVLYDDKLPEAYTQDEPRRGWSSEYHLGYAALRLVREFYAAAFPTHRVLEDGNLVEIVDEAGGNLYMLNEFDKDRRPDIADVERRFVFEVVPPGQAHQAAGKKKVDWHLLLINNAMLGVPMFKLGTGYAGEVGVRFAEGAPAWKLSWQTTEPGVVQYRWQVLGAAESTEEAHSKAYLDNRWHEPTHHEMVRFARVLHEVVERLVQAREALGRTRAAAEMPILPGKTVADYLRSVALWSAHDEGIARLLPVMREPPPPPRTRPDPRLVAQTAGGGSVPKMHPGATEPDKIVVPPHPSAPEGYTLDGLPGNMPWEFFMGYSAHRAIAWHYGVYHPQVKVYENHTSVATIVGNTGGYKMLLHWSEADLRPDITHITLSTTKENYVYEIKPEGEVHFAKGKEKLAVYIGALNVGMVGKSKLFGAGPKFEGALHIRFKDGKRLWIVQWRTTAPGLLQYKWIKPDVAEAGKDEETLKREWEQAIRDGRVRDISKTEAAADAEDLFKDFEEMMLRRELVAQFRDGMTIPIEAVGMGAQIGLSAGLSRTVGAGRQATPVLRKPVTAPQPTPARPSGTPAVNSPSLGSDRATTVTGSVHPTLRPVVPGKTTSGPQNATPN